jgi:hypothetical protein
MFVCRCGSTVTIAATDTNTATVTATNDGVFTASAGSVITQLAEAGNNLTIAISTVVYLSSLSNSIVLKKAEDNANVAKITLADTTAIIKVGVDENGTVSRNNLIAALAADGATGATVGDNISAKAAQSGGDTLLTKIIGDATDNTVIGLTSAATKDCSITGNLAVTANAGE